MAAAKRNSANESTQLKAPATKRSKGDEDGEQPTNPSDINSLEDEEDGAGVIELGAGTIPNQYHCGSYMGPSHAEDPYLAPFMQTRGDTGVVSFVTRGIRVLTREVSFAVYNHDCECDTIIMTAYKTKWEQLERTVAPFREQLLALYLRFVDWTYPAVDKKRFYRAYLHGDPPLHRGVLCAMLALGSTYWKYSTKLCICKIPVKLDRDLWAMCLHYIQHDIDCEGATLDTMQALLLYNQRRMIGDGIHEQVSGRIHVGTIVSLAFSLGLHLDCTDWEISDIEKMSRKRLWALVFFSDTWTSANLGAPSMLSSHRKCYKTHIYESGFPQEQYFVQLVRLTNILSHVLDDLYQNSQTVPIANGVEAESMSEKSLALLAELKQWRNELPENMQEMSTKNTRKYCSNGTLHISALTVEVLIFRVLLQPCYGGKYRLGAKELVQKILIFCVEITHAHLHAFWISNCRLCISSIVHFVLRYHAQAPAAERKKNTAHIRSWLECLRSLSHAWEEGVGLAYHRIDSLFHKGQTPLELPLSDEVFREIQTLQFESQFDSNQPVEPISDEEILALDEEFINYDEQSTPQGMFSFDENLHDVLQGMLWD